MVKRNNSDFYLISLRRTRIVSPTRLHLLFYSKNILKDKEAGTHFHDAGVIDDAQ